MGIGKNQIAALRHLSEKGGKGHAMRGGRFTWQLSRPECYRVLESLVARGLARKLDSGKWEMTLGGGADKMNKSRKIIPDYEITELGVQELKARRSLR
ncbi:MAG: hypothetical protein E6R04_03770 [Spirochaetes bacterium]|nr:MAG: hypothetical protein E6R04_03770 [Spirochaetota bacterium]